MGYSVFYCPKGDHLYIVEIGQPVPTECPEHPGSILEFREIITEEVKETTAKTE